MAEETQPDLIIELISSLEARGFNSEEYRGSVARAIERLISRQINIDDATLTIVDGWLFGSQEIPPSLQGQQDSDNEIFKSVVPSVEKEASDSVDSILWDASGVSFLPGGNYPVLEVFVRILLQRQEPERLLIRLSEYLDRQEDENVWRALLMWFRYIKPNDKALLASFLTKLFAKYPDLSRERETAILLANVHWVIPEFVHAMLLRWQNDTAKLVQQAYGELSTLVLLMQPDLEWPHPLVEDILSNGSSPARTGAAFATAHIWAEVEEKERATGLLEKIINLSDDGSWPAITDLFRIVDEINPSSEWLRILNAMVDQIPSRPSFNSSYVVERLQSLLPHHAHLVARFANALVTKWGSDLADLRTGTAAVAPELVDIAITLHRLGPQTQEAGIELFETLIAINVHGARQTLDQIDNRFRDSLAPVRNRLPRRRQSATRRARRRT